MHKKTAIIGATDNPDRYAYQAAKSLMGKNHEVVLLGIRKGEVNKQAIVTEWPEKIEDLHSVTMYIGAPRQAEYYNYILQLKPKRVIFNPGTENPEFYKLLHENGIEVLEACTLVMLSIGNY